MDLNRAILTKYRNKLPVVPFGSSWSWWGGLVLYYVWFQAFYNALKFDEIWPYDSLLQMCLGITCNFLPIAIIWWVYLGIVFRWIQVRSRKVKIIADILAASVVAVAVNIIFALVFSVLTKKSAAIDWSGTLLNDLLVLMFMEIAYYFKSIILYQKSMEDMEQQVVRQQYETFKAQVNPHFLFNSFNLLYSLIVVDTENARLFVQKLAEMYRYVLDRHGRSRVSATEEMAFIQSYLDILKIRYRNKFSVTWTGIPVYDNFLSHQMLVPFSLQTLVENIVKHNTVSSRVPMNIEIKIEQEGITVTNPIRPRKTNEVSSSGFGLAYLESTYSSAGYSFKVNRDASKGIFEVYMDWLPPEN